MKQPAQPPSSKRRSTGANCLLADPSDVSAHGSSARWDSRNAYDKAKAKSFMKTLKVEGVSSIAFETFADVVEHLPGVLAVYNGRRLHSALGYPSPFGSKTNTPGRRSRKSPDPVRPEKPTPDKKDCLPIFGTVAPVNGP